MDVEFTMDRQTDPNILLLELCLCDCFRDTSCSSKDSNCCKISQWTQDCVMTHDIALWGKPYSNKYTIYSVMFVFISKMKFLIYDKNSMHASVRKKDRKSRFLTTPPWLLNLALRRLSNLIVHTTHG